MKEMKVKVCGIATFNQLNSMKDAGAEYAGMIFYKPSPRYVLNNMSYEEITKVRNIQKIGVFVNSPVEEVLTVVKQAGLQMVQLHGEEPPSDCEELAQHLPVIKAFRLNEEFKFESILSSYANTCSYYLFDTMGSSYGGTGKKFNWDVLKNYHSDKPFFLSGGIEFSDIEKIKNFYGQPEAENLYAIDINSRFEISPGIKDLQLVKQFIQKLNHSNNI